MPIHLVGYALQYSTTVTRAIYEYYNTMHESPTHGVRSPHAYTILPIPMGIPMGIPIPMEALKTGV